MNVLIIDGQGGGIGAQLVSSVMNHFPNYAITAVGTNGAATAAMLKAGAKSVATGENAVIVGCRNADVIVGPIGIVIADSLLGEVTPAMAVAVGQCSGKRILIPTNQCDNVVVGVADTSAGLLIQNVIEVIKGL